MKQANAILILNLPQATQALARRAGRGRPDAIKLAYEVTGFHNPKVQHEHSGDISISINSMSRPPKTETTTGQLEEPIVDAEVVEDEA
jgi:hypothetical protein